MEHNTVTLDSYDLAILRALQQNCRLSNKELAAQIHLSTTPTYERHRRLEREGFIKQYVAIIDSEVINRSFMVFCNVSFSRINSDKANDFKEVVNQWDEVVECYNVSGDCDYVLKVCVSGMKEYKDFILNKVGALDFVDRIQSVFIMDTLKQGYSVLPG